MKPSALLLVLLAACSPRAPANQPSSNNCANVGCALPPLCSETCQAPCGCCVCGSGASQCFSQDGKLMLKTCVVSRGCYELTPCLEGSECIYYDFGSAACVSSAADCDRVKAAYQFEVATFAALTALPGAAAPTADPDRPCTGNSDCVPIAGHCEIGLGACWYVGSTALTNLDNLAKLWQRLGCAKNATCDCPAQPTTGACLNRVCVPR